MAGHSGGVLGDGIPGICEIVTTEILFGRHSLKCGYILIRNCSEYSHTVLFQIRLFVTIQSFAIPRVRGFASYFLLSIIIDAIAQQIPPTANEPAYGIPQLLNLNPAVK